MLEKNYALKLRMELDKNIFNKNMCFYKYEEELQKCNYKKLQQECNNLGFYIYKVKESPIFQEEDKNMPFRNQAYIIYSNYSLTLKAKF